jgi:hypothetical protein
MNVSYIIVLVWRTGPKGLLRLSVRIIGGEDMVEFVEEAESPGSVFLVVI